MEDKRVHTIPKGISPKVNVIAWLGFKLAYYDVAVQNVGHYIIGILTLYKWQNYLRMDRFFYVLEGSIFALLCINVSFLGIFASDQSVVSAFEYILQSFKKSSKTWWWEQLLF